MRPKRVFSFAVIVAALAGAWVACTINLPTPTGSTGPVIVTQNQNSHNVGATDPTGTTTPGPGGAVLASSVRVGIFTEACTDGRTSYPDNALNAIPVGCSAKLTATPKDASNADLNLPEPAFQAMTVAWSISGGSCLDLGDDGNKFNRVVKGVAVGSCSVCATVNGLQGCARQPTGEQLVKVIQ